MTGGETDRHHTEREAADRRYNEALTAVDHALPRPALPGAAAEGQTPRRASRESAATPAMAPTLPAGWRGRLAAFIWRTLAPVLQHQQAFNAALVDDLDRIDRSVNALSQAQQDARAAVQHELETFLTFDSRLVQCLQQITPFIDTKVRSVEHALEEVRMAAAVAQRSAVASRRALERVASAPDAEQPAEPRPNASESAPSGQARGAGYVGFEDMFRGTSDEIRARQRDYADRFAGASDVLDLGCGRGELLELLRDRGISSRGIDANAEMVDVCRARGLDVRQGDALAYLSSLPDESLGGLIALQVVEHLEPDYLVRLIETAHAKLRPGASIVLETINAACWVAFFESYIRDITHVRPLHPDTLKFLVVAAGFERVDVHFRSPIAEEGRLQTVAVAGLAGPIADLAHALNANVQRLNDRLFTYLDYAVIGEKGR
jgi:SAM-dependent methyltransferase